MFRRLIGDESAVQVQHPAERQAQGQLEQVGEPAVFPPEHKLPRHKERVQQEGHVPEVPAPDLRHREGDGDDEVIKVQLDKIPSDYDTISFTVTIYEAEKRLQNFGMVENAYVRLIDEDTGEELVRFDLTEDFSTETALVVAEIYKRDGQWKFAAIGSGYDGGLKALCKEYGIDAE